MLVFTSFSKSNFYLRSTFSTFVLNQKQTPINPFLNFEYNLSGTVDKDLIRIANNTMIKKCGQLWVFGSVSDGVLMEIYLAQKQGRKVHYFIAKDDKFNEISKSDVTLENVSPWMWEYVLANKSLERWHPRLRFNKIYPLVYPAYSKRNFYLQMHISQFCLEKHYVPLNPFMLFRYFLGDTVKRELVYQANEDIVQSSNELWTFGEIADGVMDEIITAKKERIKVKYFKISQTNPVRFRQIPTQQVVFEKAELEKYRNEL